MKRYTEKHIILWKDDTWVTCPECQKIAVVTNCQVHCPHCGFEKKAEELELFAAIVKLNCPNCGTLIEQRQGGLKETNEFRQVKCPQVQRRISRKTPIRILPTTQPYSL